VNALSCTVYCLTNTKLGSLTILVISGFLVSALGYSLAKNSFSKVRFYWMMNVLALINAPLVYFSMSCDMFWFMRYYFAYALATLLLVLAFPSIYVQFLKRRFGYEEDPDLAKKYGLEKVFVLKTMLPKAFTVGKSVFVSEGLLDILDEDELSAVMFHEKFHATQNVAIPFRSLRLLTFLHISDEKVEKAADEFAERMVGREALLSAKRKIEEFYRSR